jgi:tetratricopeptide (TPR) repeat protein
MPGFGRSTGRFLIAAGVLSGLLLAGWLALRTWLPPRQATALVLRQAIASFEAKDNQTAARLLDEILAHDSANHKALLYRGYVARDAGDAAAAARFWARVPDDPPNEGGTARYLEGLLALSEHRARDAERLLLRATELHPTFLPPREYLFMLYLKQLRDGEMRREMWAIRAQRNWSLDELIASVGSHGKIHPITIRTRELEKFVAADAGDVKSALALAECLIADDRFDDALALFDRSLKANPGDPALRGRLVELLVRLDDLDGAHAILGDKHLPDDAPVELLRGAGAYLAATGRWREALPLLEQALALAPDHIPTTHRTGLALERVGRHDEATKMMHRTRLLEQVVLQDWRIESIPHQRPQLKVPMAVEIARLLNELDRSAEAAVWLEQALNWQPDDPALRSLYATALQKAQAAAPVAAEKIPAIRIADRHAEAANHVVAQGDRHPRAAAPVAATTKIPAIGFVDRHAEAGIEFQYNNGGSGSKYLLESLGGGVAAFDFDADGWPDLYFTQGRPLPVTDEAVEPWRDKLFQNRGGVFSDVTMPAGLGDAQYSQGCTAGDFDNDGFVDLAVANFGTNVLYQNNGDGTFSDLTRASGMTGQHWSSSLAFADLDRDGFLDLYVVTYVLDPYRICRPEPGRIAICSPLNYKAEDDQLFQNRGDGTFADVTLPSGVMADDGKGLGIVIADLDNDGWPDIYIANDGTPNFLFHNETGSIGGPLRFTERGLVSGAGVSGAGNSQAGMGIACADFDGDGLLDLYVTNFYFESGTLYLNQGDLLFVDATRSAHLDEATHSFLGFGTQAVDVDLDGRLDLFIANGHIDDFRFRGEPWKMRPQLFYNAGSATFVDVSRDSGDYFDGEYLGRGVARLDWNRDGLPDLAVVHQDRPAALLTNETRDPGGRLIVDLHGVWSNRDGIGARLLITAGGVTRIHEICGGDGFFASNERRVLVGLGPARTVDRLEIRWPSGQIDECHNVPAGAALTCIEGRPAVIRQPADAR